MKLFSILGVAALLVAGFVQAANAQEDSLLEQRQEPLRLVYLDRALIPEADQALIQLAWPKLASKAKFFGYMLHQPDWTYREVVSPDLPGYVMLQFERLRAGAHGRSTFTALVGRHEPRIWIVPGLYGGATPWKPAAETKHSRAVFNRVVPDEIAEHATGPYGDWTVLAMTYAALVGADPVALAVPSRETKWIKAPETTLQLGGKDSAWTVEFSDVHPQTGYRVWAVTFDRNGRAIAAHVDNYADEQPMRTSDVQPSAHLLTNVPEPQVVIMHPVRVPH